MFCLCVAYAWAVGPFKRQVKTNAYRFVWINIVAIVRLDNCAIFLFLCHHFPSFHLLFVCSTCRVSSCRAACRCHFLSRVLSSVACCSRASPFVFFICLHLLACSFIIIIIIIPLICFSSTVLPHFTFSSCTVHAASVLAVPRAVAISCHVSSPP